MVKTLTADEQHEFAATVPDWCDFHLLSAWRRYDYIVQPKGQELPASVSYNDQDYIAYTLKGKDRIDATNLYLKENRMTIFSAPFLFSPLACRSVNDQPLPFLASDACPRLSTM